MMPTHPTLTTLYVAALVAVLTCAKDTPPNIVFIVADDLGWNDIGFNNPDIMSPNIDTLAHEGVILDQHYVQPLCSPSRAALMTGTYPFKLGLQHLVILRDQAVCVPLNKTLLPEVLRKAGYVTHMVGKWHLGFCDWKCTPLQRGFDSFYGYYNSMEDYYNKTYYNGFDFRDNTEVVKSADGTYSTFLYTQRIREIIQNHDITRPLFLYLPYQNVHEPLEVPKNYSDLYPGVKDEKRKLLPGMVTALDDAVGDVINNLKNKGIYNNTLVVFTADNGGWTTYGGNNYPLRGGKFTVFEGGTRSVSFVRGPMFKTTGVRYDGLMHLVDWYPTLVEAAGASYDDDSQDGVSQWESLLSLATPSKRQEVVYNLDLSVDPVQGRAAIRVGDYKLVAGYPGMYPDWYPPAQAEQSLNQVTPHQTTLTPTEMARVLREEVDLEAPIYRYLFNLKDDPEERKNIYDSEPEVVKSLQARLDAHKTKYIPPNFPPPSPSANPTHWGGVWTPGWCPDVQ